MQSRVYQNSPPLDVTRRRFVASIGLFAGSGLDAPGQPPNRPRAIASRSPVVGVGGKGWSDMIETSQGHEVVAICGRRSKPS